jgi:lipopolysaccharide heptosyltransferase I
MGHRTRSTLLCDYPAQRIVIIKPSALGDIIHALPVLTAVRRRYPHAHIAWVVNRALEPLLQGHPDLDATLPFDRAAARSGPFAALASYARLFRRLREGRFDLALDLQGLFRSGVMTWATGAPRRVGLGCAREGATWFYTDVAPVANPDAMHAVDRCWAVAEALGVGDLPRTFRLPIAPEADAWAGQALQSLPRPWLVLGVGARWQTKCWPPQHFAALAQRALDRFGGSIILVGGGEDVALAQETAQQLHGPILDKTGQTTLPQLAAILARADVMISNDTGPLHLAVALGRAVVAPYTCTSVVENGPYGMAENAVESRVWCHGSYLTKCPRLECMAELTPERLWPVLERVLLTWQCHSRSA